LKDKVDFRDKKFIAVLLLLQALLLTALFPGAPLYGLNWAVLSLLFLGLYILAFFWSFERCSPSAKEIALLATMAALAAAARVPFTVLPGVQPTTFLVMITGSVFGAQAGFVVGALAALASNFFLGQGPWTPWQMFCWGLGGAAAAFLTGRDREFNIGKFALLCTAWGYIFGWIMNIWHWIGFIYPLTFKTFLATYLASFIFDTLHAAGNLLLALTFGRTFREILLRFKKKMTVDTG
jgi:energy-coupling factor transport system substrate-specific component